jgi:hypothetical protein
MTLTAQDCSDHIKHTLSGVVDTLIDDALITNLAGRYFFNHQDWSWAIGRTARLHFQEPLSLTAMTWTESTLTLSKAGAFAGYSFVEDDQMEITAGTGTNVKRYTVASKPDDNSVTLTTTIDDGTGTADGATDIEGTIEFNYATLPDDFGAMISVQATDSLTRQLNSTSLGHLLQLRANPIEVTSWYWWAAISHTRTPGAVTPLFELWPAPGSDENDIITMFYQAYWADLPFSDPSNELLTLPKFAEGYFLQILRAFARGFEEEDEVSLEQRLRELHRGAIHRSTVAQDARQSGGETLGAPVNGAIQVAVGPDSTPFVRTPVASPS